MTCSIKSNLITWKISKDLINEKLQKLLYLNYESAGEFAINTKTKRVGEDDNSVTIISGKKDSVYSPNAILNYHTHPISCYLQENTVLGYLSGEDIRETLVFGLMGSIGHVVITVEGTYMCQVSPCVLENLVNLNKIIDQSKCPSYFTKKGINYTNFMRGLIILTVEMYFRSSHTFRSKRYNHYKKIDPGDYVEYVESFRLGNIFKRKNDGNKLNTYGITTFVKGSDNWMTYLEYIKNYEIDTKIDLVSANGVRHDTKITVEKCLQLGLFEQIKELSLDQICTRDNGRWENKWFTMSVCLNEVTYKGHRVMYNMLSTEDQYSFLMSAQVNKDYNNIKLLTDPSFFFYDMNGLCNYKDIAKDLMTTKHIFGKHHSYGDDFNMYEEAEYNPNGWDYDDMANNAEDEQEDSIIHNFVDEDEYEQEGDMADSYYERNPEEGFDTSQDRGSLDMFGHKSVKKTKKVRKLKKLRKTSKKLRSVKKEKKEKKQVLILFGSPSCHYCTKAVSDIEKSNYKLDKRYYSDIESAINAAQEYARGLKINVHIDSIPSVFKNGKFVDRFSIKDINWS